MRSKILYIGFFLLLATLAAAQCPGPAQRTALLNLQRAIEVEGTRAGQIPLSDTCGNQRYAQYVEVNLDTIAYTPTPTGNVANLSEFVIDPTGAIFYIDWQGNSIEFAGGGSSCDVDWLQISDNSCPDAITDSIYHQRYASVGARLVWPGAEFLVNDSTTSAILVVQGSRNARGAYYDSNAGTFSMFDHGGTTPTFLFPNAGVFTFKTTGGTPQSPGGTQIEHFSIRAQDSLIRMNMYPNTRTDVTAISNFLYTDGSGNVRSNTPAALITAGGGITGSVSTDQIAYGSGSGITSSYTAKVNTALTGTSIANTYKIRVAGAGGSGFGADSIASAQIGFAGHNVENSATTWYGAWLQKEDGSGDVFSVVQNRSSNAAADAGVLVSAANAGGDPVIQYAVGATNVTTGIDNSDSDIWKIDYAAALDATYGIGVNSSNEVGIRTAPVSGVNLIAAGPVRWSLGSDATGDIWYRNAGGNMTRLGIGSAGNVLTVAAGLPSWAAPAGGGGTVTSVSAGNLSPLFTTNVATATTTPALTFTLTNQTANTVFAGPTSGGAAAPTFRALVAADIPSSAAGDFFKDGGNSFGATATLGTNDANTLALEINNITRATLNTSGIWNVTDESATTNDVVVREQIGTNSSGAPSIGFGTRSEFYAESSTTINRLQGAIQTRWSTATDGTRSSEMDFITVNTGTEAANLTIEANGDVGIVQVSPAHRLSNTSTQMTDGTTVSGNGFGWSLNSTNNYMSGFTNSSTSTTAHGLLVEANATDNATRALTVSVGSGPTRVLTVNCDQKVGVLDETPETELDVTGTTATNHLTGQNLTPTITVNTAGAGTGATASMVNAQSSDLAGRFSITSGTGATGGLWATINFDDAFATTPIVQVYNEDTDATQLFHYVNVSTTSFEFFVAAGSGYADATTYDFNFIIIGGK